MRAPQGRAANAKAATSRSTAKSSAGAPSGSKRTGTSGSAGGHAARSVAVTTKTPAASRSAKSAGASPAPKSKSAPPTTKVAGTKAKPGRGAAVVPANLMAGRTVDTRLITSPRGAATLAPVVAKKPKKSSEPLPFHLRAIDELWQEYRSLPTKDLRNFLIERYLELVRFTAERMHMKLPSEVEVDDLMSAGLFGLMDAIDAFDPDRGVKFETYCTQRIRGAIFDELRAMDWVPRLVRSRTAKVEKVRKQIEMETGRRATDAEIADRMKVAKPEFDKLQKDSRPVGIVSLNRKWFETDSSKDVREIDVIRDTKQESPVQQIQRQDLQTLITKGLSRAERLIVILYYYEEMTMKEIGTTLDLSESRVSQMHSSILARLKAQMQHREKDMAED
jgi:RNA polymerase sigma factor FliA